MTVVITKGCGKLSGITMPLPKEEDQQVYVELSFQIATRQKREKRQNESNVPEPWDDEIPDMGMRTYGQLGTNTTKFGWTNVKTDGDIDVSLPVPFNSKGKAIQVTPVTGRISESELWYSLVAPYKRKDFSVLPVR